MATDRETLLRELRSHGERLREARGIDRDELDAIAELLPRALDIGISKREIARLTGVGRPWIDRELNT